MFKIQAMLQSTDSEGMKRIFHNSKKISEKISQLEKENRIVTTFKDYEYQLFKLTESGIQKVEDMQNDILAQLENRESFPVFSMPSSLPWEERSKVIKAEIVLLDKLKEENLKQKSDIQGYATQAREKEQQLQEAKVRIEILDKKIQVVKQQAETIAQLEASVAKHKEQEIMYEETLETLHGENDALEKENLKLKRERGRTGKRKVIITILDDFAIETEEIQVATAPKPWLIQKLRGEISDLQSKLLLKDLDFEFEESEAKRTTILSRERRDAQEFIATSTVIDISNEGGKKWKSIRSSPLYQYEARKQKWNEMQGKINEVPKPEKEACLVGKISIPHSSTVVHKILLEESYLYKLHECMV
jgi:ribosomal protein L3